jgi:hypothetical protein
LRSDFLRVFGEGATVKNLSSCKKILRLRTHFAVLSHRPTQTI